MYIERAEHDAIAGGAKITERSTTGHPGQMQSCPPRINAILGALLLQSAPAEVKMRARSRLGVKQHLRDPPLHSQTELMPRFNAIRHCLSRRSLTD